MKKKSKLVEVLASAVCAVGCVASAETIVIAPGENVATNVAEQLIGAVDVQINEGDRQALLQCMPWLR